MVMTEATEVERKKCVSCDALLHPKAEICMKCGVRQLPPPGPKPNGKNKTVAALLALFTGAFGGHMFYLGRYVWGIVFFLLFWTGVPSLVAFIQFIYYLAISTESFEKTYGPSNQDTNPALIIAIVVGSFFLAFFMLGALTAIAIPAYSQYAKKSREAEAHANLAAIHAAQTAYASDHGACAADLTALGWTLPGGGTTGKAPAEWRYSTDSTCAARAESPHPDRVIHPLLIMRPSGEVVFQ